MKTRVERDSMGEMAVPIDALYGASTARAVHNFPISGRTSPRALLQAIGWIKAAAARANEELKTLDPVRARAIAHASMEVANGHYDSQFPVDMFQTGSGTSTNMNANEVIAHLSTREAGLSVHPNDHVNASQSSNDVYPTAVHLAIKGEIERVLAPAIEGLQQALTNRATDFVDVVKTGRTHLQDAVPITFGQVFAGYAFQMAEARRRVLRGAEELGAVALGGTAVGTGVNTHPQFAARALSHLATISALKVRETANHVAAQGAPDAIIDASGALRSAALAVQKVANDIRWLASGPTAGIGELILPAVQPGSSIMPGKINPVIIESLLMVCQTVIGNDAAVAAAASYSQFELHTMWPLLADRTLESIALLSRAIGNFTERAIDGLAVNRERCAALWMGNPAVATVLAPTLGYDQVATLVKDAVQGSHPLVHAVADRSDVVRVGQTLVPIAWLIGPHE